MHVEMTMNVDMTMHVSKSAFFLVRLAIMFIIVYGATTLHVNKNHFFLSIIINIVCNDEPSTKSDV